MTKCKKKTNPLHLVPNEKNSVINRSFRDIAKELKKFKKILLADPVTKDFLKSPYSKTREQVEFLDRVWTVFANKLVNDTSNLPNGCGKRILFCENGGKVFIDTSTYIEGNPKWLNYSIFYGPVKSNIKMNAESDKPTLPPENITFNPEELDLEKLNNTPLEEMTIIRAGSTQPPFKNTNPEKTKPVHFQILENHATRKEIIMALSNEYGYASRYSDTIFTPNWYVATQLFGKDGDSTYLRLSYFKF